MTTSHRLGWLALLLAALLVGCGDDDAPEAAGAATKWTCSMHPQFQLPKPGKCPICMMDLIPAGSGGPDPGPRRLAMTPAAVKLAELQTTRAVRRPTSVEVRMVGKVAYDESRLKLITARFPGRLERLFVDYTGVQVKKGEHLVEIYSPELLTAEEELLQALGAVRTAPEGLERERARRTLMASREKLRLWDLTAEQIAKIERGGKPSDRQILFAPVGGVVIHKDAVEGRYVKTGSPLFRIADLSRVWVRLDAYESDLAWLGLGQTVKFTVEAYPGREFEGRISLIDPALSERTRTVKIRVTVENRGGKLRPGMFVTGVVHARVSARGEAYDDSLEGKWLCSMHPEEVADGPGECPACHMALVEASGREGVLASGGQPPLVVPTSAVLRTGKRAIVYVKVKGGEGPVFEGREVLVGPRAGREYVVLAGLEEGEEVVTRGAFKIDSALQIDAKPSMMSPLADRGPAPVPRLHRFPEPAELTATPALRAALGPTLGGAIALSEALAADDLARSRAAVEALEPRLTALFAVAGLPEDAAAFVTAVGKALDRGRGMMTSADEIEALRAGFGELSRATLLLVASFGPAGDAPLYEAHCPMAFDDKGASWLQRAKQIDNPYFGASMLRCGTIKQTFAPRKGGGGPPAKDPDKPPAKARTWTCSMHPQIKSTSAGACPICAMDLIPADEKPASGGGETPAAKGWTCSMHPQIKRTAPGTCPICEMALIRAGKKPEGSGKKTDQAPAGLDRAALTPTLSGYLQLMRRLAADDLAGARSAAREVRRHARALAVERAPQAWRAALTRLRTAADALPQAAPIAGMRDAFYPLSNAAIALVRAAGAGARPLYVVHCPMARDNQGASWLQPDPTVDNPYYGAAMRRCGGVKETLR